MSGELNPQDGSQLSLLAKLPRLRELWITSEALTGDCVKHLSGLRRLETLHLIYLQRGKEGLKALGRIESLRNIELNTSLVDRDLPDILVQLPRLNQITLCRPYAEPIDPALIDLLKRRLPAVKLIIPAPAAEVSIIESDAISQ